MTAPSTGYTRRGRPTIRPARPIATIVAIAWIVVACFPSEGPTGVIVTNDLGSTVHMTYVIDGQETSLQDELHGDQIAPGEKKEFTLDLFDKDNRQVCSRGDLVARNASGIELARIPPPVCSGNIPKLSTFAIASPSSS